MSSGFDRTVEGSICSAWAALSGARAAAWRTPSADNLAAEDHCEQAVNDLLEKLWASYSTERRKAVNDRPMRKLVDA